MIVRTLLIVALVLGAAEPLPILVDGRLVGTLGVSGGSSAEDEVCAEAGAAALA